MTGWTGGKRMKQAYALGSKQARITRLTLENEGLRQALRPFSVIPLLRDRDPKAEDMIDAPDLAISPTMVRNARSALRWCDQ